MDLWDHVSKITQQFAKDTHPCRSPVTNRRRDFTVMARNLRIDTLTRNRHLFTLDSRFAGGNLRSEVDESPLELHHGRVL